MQALRTFSSQLLVNESAQLFAGLTGNTAKAINLFRQLCKARLKHGNAAVSRVCQLCLHICKLLRSQRPGSRQRHNRHALNLAQCVRVVRVASNADAEHVVDQQVEFLLELVALSSVHGRSTGGLQLKVNLGDDRTLQLLAALGYYLRAGFPALLQLKVKLVKRLGCVFVQFQHPTARRDFLRLQLASGGRLSHQRGEQIVLHAARLNVGNLLLQISDLGFVLARVLAQLFNLLAQGRGLFVNLFLRLLNLRTQVSGSRWGCGRLARSQRCKDAVQEIASSLVCDVRPLSNIRVVRYSPLRFFGADSTRLLSGVDLFLQRGHFGFNSTQLFQSIGFTGGRTKTNFALCAFQLDFKFAKTLTQCFHTVVTCFLIHRQQTQLPCFAHELVQFFVNRSRRSSATQGVDLFKQGGVFLQLLVISQRLVVGSFGLRCPFLLQYVPKPARQCRGRQILFTNATKRFFFLLYFLTCQSQFFSRIAYGLSKRFFLLHALYKQAWLSLKLLNLRQ